MVCLKRALKIAHAAQQQLAIALRQSDTMPAALFVEILNHYLYYFDQGLALISSTVLQVNTQHSRAFFSGCVGCQSLGLSLPC